MTKQCQAERSRSLKPNQFEIRPGVIITERPILFQTEMVQANLEDRKSQTRRENGQLKHINEPKYRASITLMKMDYSFYGDRCLRVYKNGDVYNYTEIKSPFGKAGDLLWVRETFYEEGFLGNYAYKASGNLATDYDSWKPSIHMPKDASRIWLMVENVYVERVQDISEEDAKQEGIMDFSNPKCQYYEEGSSGFLDYIPTKSRHKRRVLKHHDVFLNPISSFRSLWISINGEASWKSNPWVWVVKYRILSKNGRPSNEVIWENFKDVQYKISYPESYKGMEVPHV